MLVEHTLNASTCSDFEAQVKFQVKYSAFDYHDVKT